MIFSLRPASRGLGPTSAAYLQEAKSGEPLTCPLVNTKVTARVDGFIATCTIEQVYVNQLAPVVEAVYVFPVAHDAAVTGFAFSAGERSVRGDVRARLDARAAYAAAREVGRASALLEQDRRNVFTLSVGRLKRGEKLVVRITTVQALPYQGGAFTFRLPLVVQPRHLPGTLDVVPLSDGAPAHRPQSAMADSMQPDAYRLLQDRRPGCHTVQLELTLRAGIPLEGWSCPTHALAAREVAPGVTALGFAGGDVPPDRDLVVRIRPAGSGARLGLLAHRTDAKRGGSFVAYVIPPGDVRTADLCPREVVFLLDVSGSMAGRKLEQARDALRGVLRGLNPGDTFNVCAFDTGVRTLSEVPLPFSDESLERAEKFLRALTAGGGTDLLPGIRWALEQPWLGRGRHVLVITDGGVCNEAQVVAVTHGLRNGARVHALGIDSAVNDAFIHDLARVGRGFAELALPDEDISGAVRSVASRIDAPLVRDPRLELAGVPLEMLAPCELPDLGAGDVLVVAGRYRAPGVVRLTLAGRASAPLPAVELALPEHADNPAVETVWARLRLLDLERQAMLTPGDAAVERRIANLARAHGLVSSQTAFVAVDEAPAAHAPRSCPVIIVPAELPHGWVFEPRAVPAHDPGASAPLGARSPLLHGLFGFGWLRGLATGPAAPVAAGPRVVAATVWQAPPRDELSLRALAMEQRADGTWGSVARTAEALIALVSAGHTDASGVFRAQVRRAFEALESARPADAAERTLLARAFALLAQTSGAPHHAAALARVHPEPLA